MTQEEKDLLLRDLCARLPYGVKVQTTYIMQSGERSDIGIDVLTTVELSMLIDGFEEHKPYLFPLSNMTPKQKAELSMLVVGVEDIFKSFLIEVEFYHKHHIDYRGLIPMGLAFDATGLNIY